MQPVPYQESSVTRLLERVARADGHPPLSGHKIESIDGDRFKTGAWSDGSGMCVVGVAALHQMSGDWAVEIAVAPECRGSRQEEEAIRAATNLVPAAAVHTIWAFRAEQIEAAERLGYREVRAVLRMGGPIPQGIDASLPRVTIDAMAPEDVNGIVAVNNQAFADHPEQGAMTAQDLDSLVGRPWFDASGVLVATDGERVIGFCITKREGNAAGEIFVIAVDPDHQRCGVGRTLIGSSLRVLRDRGVRTVSLWVDATNATALRFYASLGLAEDFRTREFTLPPQRTE